MSYHRRMASAASAKDSPHQIPKTLDAEDASTLALLAYRVVLHDKIDANEALGQLNSVTAKRVGRAVLGSTRHVDTDTIDFAERLKEWARRNAGIGDTVVKAE